MAHAILIWIPNSPYILQGLQIRQFNLSIIVLSLAVSLWSFTTKLHVIQIDRIPDAQFPTIYDGVVTLKNNQSRHQISLRRKQEQANMDNLHEPGENQNQQQFQQIVRGLAVWGK